MIGDPDDEIDNVDDVEEDDSAKVGDRVKRIIAFLYIALAGLGLILGGYFARDMLDRFWTSETAIKVTNERKMIVSDQDLGAGLNFRRIKTGRIVQAGASILVVNGEIANSANTVLTVPNIGVILYDVVGAIVLAKEVALEHAILDIGLNLPFKVRLIDVPPSVRYLKLKFKKQVGRTAPGIELN